MELKLKRLHEDVQMPERGTKGAAAMDLRAYTPDKIITLLPGQRELIPTGLTMELPSKETVGLVFARSGLAVREGLAAANGVGVIDSDYRGEICFPAINNSNKTVHIKHGDRIAQLMISPVLLPKVIEVNELTETKRGIGGFGSTGKE